MQRFRFHLGTLVSLVLVFGVGFAALRESIEIWDSGVFTLTLGILLTSVLLAIHRTETRRAFWLGFTLFGAAYLGVSLVPSLESRLMTTKTLAFLESKIARSIPNDEGLWYADDYDENEKIHFIATKLRQSHTLYVYKGDGTFQNVTGTLGLNQLGNQETTPDTILLNMASGPGRVVTTENFMRIGHSLIALIAAMIGGQLSRQLYGKKREPVQEPARPQGSTSSVGSKD